MQAVSHKAPEDVEKRAPYSGQESRKGRRVVVIGAGLAGLTAARMLSQTCQVELLDAQNRIGGRVCSALTAQGIPVELGAQWIHGYSALNPLHGYVESGKVSAKPYDESDLVIYNRGTRIDPLQSKRLWDLSRKIDEEIYEEGQSGESLASACQRVARKFDGAEELKLAHLLLLEELQQDFGTSPDGISYAGYRAEVIDPATKRSIKIKDKDNKGGDFFVVGGFSKLLDYLSHGLKILLNSPVCEVEYSSNVCRVSYQQNGERSAKECDYVICTVPLGVLQSGRIKFCPSLPKPHLDAIHALKMGSIVKVILVFKESYWEQATWLSFISRKANVTVLLNLNKYYANSNTLVAMISGKKAEKFAKMDQAQIQSKVLKRLSRAYPECREKNLLSCFVQDWSKNEYVQGAYSYVPTGSSIASMHALQQPVGLLVLAGEHTHFKYVATMQAAILSGQEAALKILDQLSKR